MTINDLRMRLANGESSESITRSVLESIESDNHNAFISSNPKAITQAQAADVKIKDGSAGPLTGIPFSVKDVLTTAGLATTAGSNMLRDFVPSYTATAVQRLLDQGMVLVGKNNCDEFAMGSSNENSAFGPVKNPHDHLRVSGGSSGGSAVAVAANIVPISLGTDTGGSVRQPAAFCGVYGLKPTYGRVSRYGLMAMASSLDQVGIFSNTIDDMAAVLGVIAGPDKNDSTAQDMRVDNYLEEYSQLSEKIVIGLPKEYFAETVDHEVQKLIEQQIEAYKKIPGVSFKEVSIPHTKHALAAYYIVMPSEVSANMARYDGLRYGNSEPVSGSLEEQYAHNRSALGAEVRRRIMLGTFALSAGYFDAYYAQASKVRTLLAQDFSRVFDEVDAVLTPATPTPAFKIGEKTDDPMEMYLSDIYTVSANLVGIPGITIPIGTVRDLPISIQLMGQKWSESRLFSIANQLSTTQTT